jgi:hypothetical protein
MRPTLIISDLHIPYEHPDALDFCVAVRDKYKTEDVISVGDELDWHACSFHDHNPDLMSAGDELHESIVRLKQWRTEFPAMRLCHSNHGTMLQRKAFANGIPSSAIQDYTKLYQTPGWSWHREIIEDMHGVPLIVRHQFGRNVRASLSRIGDACAIWGHFHTCCGVEWRNNLNYRQFAACVGCLIDPKHQAFAYDQHNLDRPMLACATVIDGNLTLHPMFTNKRGRWSRTVS